MRLIFGLFMLTSVQVMASVLVMPTCRNPWTIQATRDQQNLNLKIREADTGPACDLVVKNFDYLDDAQILSVQIVPAKFCPLDAVARRQALLVWQLPQELRSKGSLKLIVNGSEVGILSIDWDKVDFNGGCQ